MTKTYDAVIIGGGFYGLRIATFMYDELGYKDILVIEKEKQVMQHASYNNQARVHRGYHYPRSVLTAVRSKVNFPIFVDEYKEAIVTDFDNYYAVAKNFSKVSAQQFIRFFERIDVPIKQSDKGMVFFDKQLVEQVYDVKEYVFDSAKLCKILLKDIKKRDGIIIKTNEYVNKIIKQDNGILVRTNKDEYSTARVINSTYSSINQVNKASGLPVIPLKHELTEMCLVDVPDSIKGKAFTLMCGPFFSLMPFPDKNCYTLSHVRYTPHSEWHDTEADLIDPHQRLIDINPPSNFPQMYADVRRYLKEGKDIKYRGESLWEVKTVLPQSESDDSRPILYKEHHGGIQNYVCIMGGKIDNIYDVFRELRNTYGKKEN